MTEYALRHDGAWFAYLEFQADGFSYATVVDGDAYEARAVFAGELRAGEPLGDSRRGYDRRGWWRFPETPDDPPGRIEIKRKPSTRVAGYRVGGEYRHLIGEKYPETVDEDWMRGYRDEDGDVWEPTVRAIYEAVRETVEHDPVTLPGPFVRLDGPPPPRDGRTWTAPLPMFLTTRTEYLHLFPGYLSGFRDAVKRHLEALDDLSINFYTHGASPSIYVKVPGGSGIVYSNDRYFVPDRIEGANREEASRAWDAKLAEVEADVRAKAEVCPHCGGTGRPRHVLEAEAAAAARKRRRGRR
jgi:hypothetical protein